jgi:hypothetical protein
MNYFNVSKPTCPMQLHVHHEHYRVGRVGDGPTATATSTDTDTGLGSGKPVLTSMHRWRTVAPKPLVDDVAAALRVADVAGLGGAGVRGRKSAGGAPAPPSASASGSGSASARKRKQPSDSDSEEERRISKGGASVAGAGNGAGAGKGAGLLRSATAFDSEGLPQAEAVALAVVRHGAALRMVTRYGPRLSLVSAQVRWEAMHLLQRVPRPP